MLSIRPLVLATFAALAVIAFATQIHTAPSRADSPHPGLSFGLGINVDGDSDNDCGTGVPTAVGNGAPDPVSVQVTNTTCEVREGATFRANIYLMSNAGLAAGGIAAHALYSGGVASGGIGDSVWEGCSFEATASGLGFENTGCSIGLPPASAFSGVGLIATFTFTCTGDGTVAIGHGVGETEFFEETLEEHREAGPDSLSIICQEGLPGLNGDADCNGSINSIDAALILQNGAGLLPNLPCPDGGDVDDNGIVNAIDAALVLQFTAGLLDEL